MSIFKSISKIILLLSATFLLTDCSNEVDVIGDWKEIPVVYAVFGPNPDLGANYFRIEKAFLDPKTDALVIAKRPDSIYYGVNELEVILFEKFREDTSYRVIDTLEMVDANTIGITRDSGIFATTPNYVYKSDAQIVGSDRDRFYKLEIRNKTNGKVFTQFCRGLTMGFYNFGDNAYSCFNISTPSLTNTAARPINWCIRNPVTNNFEYQEVRFNWLQPKNAAIYDLTIVFKYFEFEVDVNQPGEPEIPNTRVTKELVWKAIKNNIQGGTTLMDNDKFYLFTPENPVCNSLLEPQKIAGENFYTFLSSNLSDVSNSNIRRCVNRIDLRVDAGGPEFAEMLRARNSNQNLIGGLFPSDPFSNIEDGIGIFTYKFHIRKNGYQIGAESIQFLNENESTRKLGFKSTVCN